MKPNAPSEGVRPASATTERFLRPAVDALAAHRVAIEAALSSCRAAETAARRKDRDHRFGR